MLIRNCRFNPVFVLRYAGQYAAMGYAPAGSAAVAGGGGAGCAVSAASGVLQPTAVSQSLSLDASQAQAQAQANAVAGMSFGSKAKAFTYHMCRLQCTFNLFYWKLNVFTIVCRNCL